MNPIRQILMVFLLWRAALFIPIILAPVFLDYGSFYPYFEISFHRNLPTYLETPILKTWSNFDGVHFLNIAGYGYITEARFFPLLPILIYLFSLGSITFTFTFLVGLILPNIIFILALVFLYKLLRLDYSEKISFDAIFYLLIFPTAFFLVSVYSESLFLLLLVICFYCARKGNWIGVILSGVFLVGTRFVGIFIIPALIYEFIIQTKLVRLNSILKLCAIILVTPISLALYSIYNFQKWGNPLYFLTAHTELGNDRSASSLILPPQTLYRYFKILNTLPVSQFEWWLALLEVASFVFGCIALFIAWKKKIRVSYLIFGVLSFLLPVLSGTFSGLPRYLLIVFPVFIAIALIQSKFIKQTYSVISIILLLILLMFFSRGYFIA